MYVVAAQDDSKLRRGPGWIAGSAAIGSKGSCIIAGHRDLHFRALKDVRIGDDIVVTSETGSYDYRVLSLQVVVPGNTQILQPVFERQLTLVTCYPFYYLGAAPKRYIVRAALQE
jgi:sortase A